MLRPSGINRSQNATMHDATGPVQNANDPMSNANGPMPSATPTDPATANVVARHRVASVDPGVPTVPLNAASVDPELAVLAELAELAVLADTR
jgi:hypothetical protein